MIAQKNYWQSSDISDFVRMIRPVLILLICMTHIPFLQGYGSDIAGLDTPQSLFSVYINDVISRSSVPLLSVISGYYAYQSYMKHGYHKLTTNKIKSVLIPFLTANVLTFIFLYIVQVYLLSNSFTLIRHTGFDFNTFRSILGLNMLPVNAPSYFIRDLFLIFISVPLIHYTSRNKYLLTFVLIFLFYMIYTSKTFYISTGEYKLYLIYRIDMIIFFILGYFISRNALRIRKINKLSTPLLAYALITFSACMILVELKPENLVFLKYRWVSGLITILFISAIFGLFMHSNKRIKKILDWLSPYSFMIFLTHFPVAVLFGKAIAYMKINISQESNMIYQISYSIVYLTICILAAVISNHSLKLLKHKTLSSIA